MNNLAKAGGGFLIPEERVRLFLRQLSEEIKKVDSVLEAKECADQAEALRAWTVTIKAGEDVARESQRIVVRAERRLGEITSAIPKYPGSRLAKLSVAQCKEIEELLHKGNSRRAVAALFGVSKTTIDSVAEGGYRARETIQDKKEILAAAGVPWDRCADAQALAKPPEEQFEAAMAQLDKPTVGGTLRVLGKRQWKVNSGAVSSRWRVLADRAVALLAEIAPGDARVVALRADYDLANVRKQK